MTCFSRRGMDSRLGWGGRSADPENRMSRSGLTSPPAAERRDDLPALAEPASGGRWNRPRRRAVCLFIACAGVLVTAGVAGGVIGLRGADRPAGHRYAHEMSAARSHKPAALPAAGGPAAGTLPASGAPAGVLPYAPTAGAFPAGSERPPRHAPRRSLRRARRSGRCRRRRIRDGDRRRSSGPPRRPPPRRHRACPGAGRRQRARPGAGRRPRRTARDSPRGAAGRRGPAACLLV